MSIASTVFGTKKRIVFACTTIFCSTILFSAFSTPTHAEEMGASIEIPPSLTLSVPASVSMNVTPGVKDFDSKSCNIVVGTNSIAGYTLTTSATSTNLTNTTDSTKTISTLPSSSEGYTESNFVANKWGYKIGNGNYKPYVSEATLADTHEQTAGDTTALTFATKVDFDQPTGTYNLTVNFSAVAKVYVPPYMQDFTVAEVNAMDEGETKNLIDSRDNQSYTVAKLPDGNVWMTKNLDLAGGTTLTPSDSNVSSNYTLPASSTSGFSNDSTAYVYNSGSTTCGNGSPCYSYYSYVAATAGTNPSTDGESATSDICPKGWRLPTKAEYETLASTYTTGATLTAAPFLGVYGGLYDNSSFSYGGSLGDYWSSTALVFDDGRADDAYIFLFGSSYVRVTFDYRRGGYSVRCVKDMAPAMQDVAIAQVNSMSDGDTLNVVDSRDGQKYTTVKINGLLWMTQNLRFTGTNIDSSTTNIDTTKTLSYGDLTSGHSYTEPRIHDSGDATTGVWYNYCAATAGTICTSSNNTTEASYSLCPSGWRLPTYAEQQAITSYTTAFSPVAGGYYYGDSLVGTGYGLWWSSTANDGGNRYSLGYNGSSLLTSLSDRSYGIYVRCVLDARTIADVTNMQDVTSDIAARTAVDTTATLTDSRDNQTYTVAKLPDGNLWMTQNLRFTGTSIDSSTTNIDTTKTLSYGDLTSGNSYTEPRIHNSGDATTGVWYNYCAATAGTICTDSDSTEASYSLCPAGWRLPTYAEQQAVTSYTTAFTPVAGGRYYNGSLSGTSVGFWWSSTAGGNTDRYLLFYNGSSLDTGGNYRYGGLYVRCVLDARTIADVTNMQDVTSDMAARTAVGTTATLTDSRDNQTYTVAKLPDGNVWMTQNLDLAGGTTLTPSDSNVSSNYTLPASSNDSASFSDDSTAYIYNSGSTTCGDNSPCYSYYSYVAATAGTNLGYGEAATSDICPKGWRLPSYDEFSTLTSTYTTGDALTVSPFLGVYGGSYCKGKFSSGGTAGSYWTSMSMTLMMFNAQSAYASGGYIPSCGHSVRCVKS